MDKEIGGYFGLEYLSGKEYYADLIGVNSARNALLYIMKAKQIKKLYIPSFLCDSISGLCQRENYTYEEYAVDQQFRPIFTRKLKSGEYLYIVNYYGQIHNTLIREMKKHWGNIIVDNVQAFFQEPVPGVDTIYSCRKFFGVPDGAYVATDVFLEEELLMDKSMDRMRCVLGRFEGTASDYYCDYQATGPLFEQMPLRQMSALTRNILRAVDYTAVKNRRNENYCVLEKQLKYRNPLQLTAPNGAFCYPFYCKDGLQVKKALAKKKIYVPTLWPNVIGMEAGQDSDYAENILPLPCDQRYSPEDMRLLLDALEEILCKLEQGGL